MISRNRGFGLIEIMVGMVIGLIVMLVIMQVSTVFERQKRDTTTGGDAQTNGAMSLYLMEREVRAAGSGMTEGEPQKYPPLVGCLTRVYNTAAYLTPNINPAIDGTLTAAATAANIRFAPVVISDGGGGLSDSLTLAYGTSVITAPYTLSAGYNPAVDAAITLTSNAGIGVNDMFAVVETDIAVPATNGNYLTPRPCVLLQATALPDATTVSIAAGQYNRAGGTGLAAFTDEARIYNLGQLNLVTYRISQGNLVADISKFGVIPNGAGPVTPVVNRTDFSPLASNIVNMQVQYGVDTGNPLGPIQTDCKTAAPGSPLTATDADAIVDAWVDPTATWANNGATLPSLFDLRRVRAVRIGLVARSGVKEVAVGACTTTTTAPTISWDTGPAMAPDLSGDAEWQCYRYKVFQTTIPVRNALWSSTMNPASSATCGLRDPA